MSDIDKECLTPRMFDLHEFTYTHKGHIFTGHIGAGSWTDAVEKLASARDNARLTGKTVAWVGMKSEMNYKAAWQEYNDKTEWVQTRQNWPFPVLGMHRADVLNKYIEGLEKELKQMKVHANYLLCAQRPNGLNLRIYNALIKLRSAVGLGLSNNGGYAGDVLAALSDADSVIESVNRGSV